MRKAIILFVSVIVLLGAAISYGVHQYNRQYGASFYVSPEYAEMLDKVATKPPSTAGLDARAISRQAHSIYGVEMYMAKVAHDEALAKVANLATDDPDRLDAIRKADAALKIATGLANAHYGIALTDIDGQFHDADKDAR